MNCEKHKNWPVLGDSGICILCKIEEKQAHIYKDSLQNHERMIKGNIQKEIAELSTFFMYVFWYFVINIFFNLLMFALLSKENGVLHLICFIVSIPLTMIMGKSWKRKKIKGIELKFKVPYPYDYSMKEAEAYVQNLYPIEYADYINIKEKRERKRENRIRKSWEKESERRNPAKKIPSAITVKELLSLSPTDFEFFIAGLFKKLGFQEIRVTKASGDFGVDILCRDSNGEKTAIQCKRYQEGNTVRFSAIQEVLTAKHLENCTHAMVITTSKYTKQAIEAAEKLGITLWDHSVLQANLDKVNMQKSDAI